ncbi:hypothetical protein BOQ60_26445, partial [Chryseobacterium sp. CH1]
GKPSCIQLPSGEFYMNSFGLDEKIVNQCLNRAAQARKLKIPITTFMIAQDRKTELYSVTQRRILYEQFRVG